MERFNYYEFVKAVEKTCLTHPMVSNFYTERYSLATTDDIEYPAVVLTHNGVSIGENATQIDFNLLYVNRLTESRANVTEIQSVGVDVIAEVVNALRNQFDMDTRESFTVRIFEEHFADNVAGAFGAAKVQMASNIGMCDWLDVQRCGEKNI